MALKNIIVGGLSRVRDGVFGTVKNPAENLSTPGEVIGDTKAEIGFYGFHEGALFTPGTGNWVFEPGYETPLDTIWGHAFLRTANTFKPLQPPQIMTYAKTVPNGIGGQVAGQMMLQPLIDTAPDSES